MEHLRVEAITGTTLPFVVDIFQEYPLFAPENVRGVGVGKNPQVMLKPVASPVALPGRAAGASSTSYNVPPCKPGFDSLPTIEGRK